MEEIRTSVDLRDMLPPVAHQGRRSTCVAFAATTAHEYASRPWQLSPEFLYWACKQTDCIPGEGTSLEAAADALRTYGQCLWNEWPYTPSPISYTASSYRPTDEALVSALQHQVSDYQSVSDCESICRELQKGHLVILAVRLFKDWAIIRDGIIPMPTSTAEDRGLHAVLAVGYVGLPPKGYLVIRNSWGENWGDHGYALLSFDYLRRFQYGVGYTLRT